MKYASIEEIMTSSSYRTYYLNCPHITHYSIDQKLAYLIVIKYFIVRYKVGGVGGVMYDNFTGRWCVWASWAPLSW